MAFFGKATQSELSDYDPPCRHHIISLSPSHEGYTGINTGILTRVSICHVEVELKFLDRCQHAHYYRDLDSVILGYQLVLELYNSAVAYFVIIRL